MNFKNENRNSITDDQPATHHPHLIDIPPVKSALNQKTKGNNLSHPKAGIRTLTAFFHKNGMSNLL
jgi:hypothetical protein